MQTPPIRHRLLNEIEYSSGSVMYWMSRDQRVNDNWALLFAQKIALDKQVPLIVYFNVVEKFLDATSRNFQFMLSGLQEIEIICLQLNIPFIIRVGDATTNICNLIQEHKIGAIVTDFDPLKIKKEWKSNLIKHVKIPIYEVDTHNIVPCWIASPKQEFGAYTLRPKLSKIISDYLIEIPKPIKHPYIKNLDVKNNWSEIKQPYFNTSNLLLPSAGESVAIEKMNSFLQDKLSLYFDKQNDPTEDATSCLSPYIHFGQLSSQRLALAYLKRGFQLDLKDQFLDQVIVRKELSDNFCNYNLDYDSFEGFPLWAKQTLLEHMDDKREYLYSLDMFEHAQTHDDLWNGAQKEMVLTGRMHGYMRMYWAKKILEWSRTPDEALQTAIFLNDKYELDGRDANGYTGCAWAIGGVHDRAWSERPVSGKIRYMNYNGCNRKFDIQKYLNKIASFHTCKI